MEYHEVDDVIRNGVEAGQKHFHWSAEDWAKVEQFAKVNGYAINPARFMLASHSHD